MKQILFIVFTTCAVKKVLGELTLITSGRLRRPRAYGLRLEEIRHFVQVRLVRLETYKTYSKERDFRRISWGRSVDSLQLHTGSPAKSEGLPTEYMFQSVHLVKIDAERRGNGTGGASGYWMAGDLESFVWRRRPKYHPDRWSSHDDLIHLAILWESRAARSMTFHRDKSTKTRKAGPTKCLMDGRRL